MKNLFGAFVMGLLAMTISPTLQAGCCGEPDAAPASETKVQCPMLSRCPALAMSGCPALKSTTKAKAARFTQVRASKRLVKTSSHAKGAEVLLSL